MAKNKLKSLDINPIIGTVNITGEETSFDVPRLDLKKIIGIVKFIGTDGVRIYSRVRETLKNDEISSLERIVAVVDELKDEQLIRVIAIILEVDDEEALKLDLNEMLDVLILLVENTNLSKTFTQVRHLANKMYGVEIPDMQTVIQQWMEERFPDAEENQPEEVRAEVSD